MGGLTRDLMWGAEETLLLLSLYFFGKIGGGWRGGGGALRHPCAIFPGKPNYD